MSKCLTRSSITAYSLLRILQFTIAVSSAFPESENALAMSAQKRSTVTVFPDPTCPWTYTVHGTELKNSGRNADSSAPSSPSLPTSDSGT